MKASFWLLTKCNSRVYTQSAWFLACQTSESRGLFHGSRTLKRSGNESSARGLNSTENSHGKILDMCWPLGRERKELYTTPCNTINNNCKGKVCGKDWLVEWFTYFVSMNTTSCHANRAPEPAQLQYLLECSSGFYSLLPHFQPIQTLIKQVTFLGHRLKPQVHISQARIAVCGSKTVACSLIITSDSSH